MPLRVLVVGALLLAGAVTGLGVLLVHATGWGLALGAAASLAVLLALPPGFTTRVAYALGMALLLVAAARPRPEGDYLIGSGLLGYGLLGLSLVLVVAAVVSVPRRPHPSAPPTPPGEDSRL
ncbi:hypothetical protein BKA08_002186 [Nocardioides marinisabuli]|uniref:Uncharacterized protein n=1 Tax=Nocardioides marinisabuli TaxID=419476 RepID=A0A7Y9F1T6_9ACTN|nr:hypothetical protein [Nocardioides marinisabuli]NYD57948.1 hypothetical protein [Nocardioides marinisabuli]